MKPRSSTFLSEGAAASHVNPSPAVPRCRCSRGWGAVLRLRLGTARSPAQQRHRPRRARPPAPSSALPGPGPAAAGAARGGRHACAVRRGREAPPPRSGRRRSCPAPRRHGRAGAGGWGAACTRRLLNPPRLRFSPPGGAAGRGGGRASPGAAAMDEQSVEVRGWAAVALALALPQGRREGRCGGSAASPGPHLRGGGGKRAARLHLPLRGGWGAAGPGLSRGSLGRAALPSSQAGGGLGGPRQVPLPRVRGERPSGTEPRAARGAGNRLRLCGGQGRAWRGARCALTSGAGGGGV